MVDDNEPSNLRSDGVLEEGKQITSPRTGSAHFQLGCSSSSRLIWEIWRRIRLEVVVEWPLLKQRWKVLLFGIVMQYVHGVFTQLAHRMHQPQELPLHDVGFDLTPELGPEEHWVSEAIFGVAFATFVLWTFSPFVSQRKRFYTVVMWTRLLMVLVVCQALRIVTFSVTQLPGPSFHCRANEQTSRRPWPAHWTGHLVVDVSRQVSKSCGDLIFSSHTTFILTGILAYNEYGSLLVVKSASWTLGVVLSILIIASRKHYTVDVVIAWYTVPLVFFSMYRRWTTRRPMSDFIGSTTSPAFDDVDGSEMELEEVLIERGTCGGGELFGCMDGGGLGGKIMARPSTIKVSVRSLLDGRCMGMSSLSSHHALLGSGDACGGFSGSAETKGGSSNALNNGHTWIGTQGKYVVPVSLVRGTARSAMEGLEAWQLQQKQQPGQQPESDRGIQGALVPMDPAWLFEPNS
uniref:MTM1058 n=2 Tax=Volvox carteri f. nagariensis TaxID=3068 RepID=D9CJ96_VOLCA|nr:MTM1058 [Volvox carteri f. nagariensis]